MQSKVESRQDFATIKNDPIQLLSAIKQYTLNYQEHRSVLGILLDAMMAVLTCKQKENESLQDYVKRFKTAQDVLESHVGGPIIFNKFAETMPGFVATDNTKVKECAEKAKSISLLMYFW